MRLALPNLLLPLICSLVALCACVSEPKRNFERLHLGMEKSAVLEMAGSPTITRRWQGKDRWIYEFRDHSDNVVVREVEFEGGRSVYVGPKVNPSVSAAEQDRINEAIVSDERHRLSEEEAAHDRQVGAQRPSRVRKSEDDIDHDLRESMYGVAPDPERERRKTAPVWEPVR